MPISVEPDGFRAALPPVQLAATLRPERAAAAAPPVRLGPALPWRPVGVAQAPSDAVWTADAAEWRVRLTPERMPSGVSNVFLRLRYVGDEARLAGPDGALLDDNFWNGQPWLVGLRRFRNPEGALPDLQLQMLPIRADAPVYLQEEARTALPPGGQTLALRSVKAVPEYGATENTVTVTANASVINTTTAEISNLVNERAISQLPLNCRDPSSLVLLSPGTTNVLNTGGGYLQSGFSFPAETGAPADGGRQGSTYYLLDGVVARIVMPKESSLEEAVHGELPWQNMIFL